MEHMTAHRRTAPQPEATAHEEVSDEQAYCSIVPLQHTLLPPPPLFIISPEPHAPGVWKEARKATWRLRMCTASFTNRLGKPSAKRLQAGGRAGRQPGQAHHMQRTSCSGRPAAT